MRQLFKWPEAMEKIAVIRDHEEGRYTDPPKAWDGWVENYTESAILFNFNFEPRRRNNQEWIPLSQIRKAGDGQSIYFTTWICDKKGI